MIKEMMNDKLMFITNIIIILTLPLYFTNASSLTVGGLLLMYGAWYVATGNVFYSIIVYTLADICWLINALTSNDVFAAVTVSVGISTGLYVTYKMQKGTFRKSILKDIDE